MSEFACPVVEITLEGHPDADRLEIAKIGGYACIVGKDNWRTGDRAVYIPEAAIVPDAIIDELGLKGKLAGKNSNRVKAVRLRGVVSQGLLLPLDSSSLRGIDCSELGGNYASELGIRKYEPEVPVHMQGQLAAAPTIGFDVENWQMYGDVFKPGESVQVTEKLHGTFCEVGFDLEHGPVVASKSPAGRSLGFKVDAEENKHNLYVSIWQQIGDSIKRFAEREETSVYLMGEIVGRKIQDMTYGLERPSFFVFDSVFDKDADVKWNDPSSTVDLADELRLDHVPVVDSLTEFDLDAILSEAQNPSLIGGGLREGVVVRPTRARYERDLGRAILKFVNPKYLTRKGGTEFN